MDETAQRVRDIALGTCVALEAVQAVLIIAPFDILGPLLRNSERLGYVSCAAFVLLAVAVFWQFSLTWLRAAAVALVFYLLPILLMLGGARYTNFLPGPWPFLAVLVLVVCGHLVRAVIAWAIYRVEATVQ